MRRWYAPGCESTGRLQSNLPQRLTGLTSLSSNIWSPLKNVRIVKAIANKYKFSTRLQGTIIGWDEARRQVAEKLSKEPTQKSPKSADLDNLKPKRRRTGFAKQPDGEKGIPDDGDAISSAAIARDLGLDKLHQEDLHMYKLLQEQYNYTTIDHGPNCKSSKPVSETAYI